MKCTKGDGQSCHVSFSFSFCVAIAFAAARKKMVKNWSVEHQHVDERSTTWTSSALSRFSFLFLHTWHSFSSSSKLSWPRLGRARTHRVRAGVHSSQQGLLVQKAFQKSQRLRRLVLGDLQVALTHTHIHTNEQKGTRTASSSSFAVTRKRSPSHTTCA